MKTRKSLTEMCLLPDVSFTRIRVILTTEQTTRQDEIHEYTYWPYFLRRSLINRRAMNKKGKAKDGNKVKVSWVIKVNSPLTPTNSIQCGR